MSRNILFATQRYVSQKHSEAARIPFDFFVLKFILFCEEERCSGRRKSNARVETIQPCFVNSFVLKINTNTILWKQAWFRFFRGDSSCAEIWQRFIFSAHMIF